MKTENKHKVGFIEEPKGKFIVCPNEDFIYFLGLNPEFIGDHKSMYNAFAYKEFDKMVPWLLEREGRASVLESIKLFDTKIKEPIGGGEYLIRDKQFNISGESGTYGSVDRQILELLSQPIREYFRAKGNDLFIDIE